MEEKILPGGIYAGITNGKKYQVITLAEEQDTKSILVIYQELFEPFKVCAKEKEQFQRQVMAGKMDEAPTKATESPGRSGESGAAEALDCKSESTTPQEDGLHPMFRHFLDAEGYSERLEILKGMRDIVDNGMINSMAVIMDMEIKEGPIEERYEDLMECIRTKCRYEIERY